MRSLNPRVVATQSFILALLWASILLLAPADLVVYLALSAYLVVLLLVQNRMPRDGAEWSPVFWYNAVSLALVASGGAFLRFASGSVRVFAIDVSVWNAQSICIPLLALMAFNSGIGAGSGSRLYSGRVRMPSSTAWGVIGLMTIALALNFWGFYVGGVPAFNPNIYKGSYWDAPWLANLLLVLAYAIPVVCPAIVAQHEGALRRVAVLLFIGFLVFGLLLTNRNTVLLGLMCIPVMYSAIGRRVRFGALALAAAAVFVVAMLFGVYRGALKVPVYARATYASERVAYSLFGNQYEKLRLDSLATEPFVSRLVRQLPPGRLMFSGFYQLLPGKQESDDIILRGILYGASRVESGLATPFHTVALIETGYFGMVVGMLALGWFSSLAYNTYRFRWGIFEFGAFVYLLWLLLIKTLYANLFSRVDVIVVGALLAAIALTGRADEDSTRYGSRSEKRQDCE